MCFVFMLLYKKKFTNPLDNFSFSLLMLKNNERLLGRADDVCS